MTYRSSVTYNVNVVSLEIIINIGVAWTINLQRQRLDNNKRITGMMRGRQGGGAGRGPREERGESRPRSA